MTCARDSLVRKRLTRTKLVTSTPAVLSKDTLHCSFGPPTAQVTRRAYADADAHGGYAGAHVGSGGRLRGSYGVGHLVADGAVDQLGQWASRSGPWMFRNG